MPIKMLNTLYPDMKIMDLNKSIDKSNVVYI